MATPLRLVFMGTPELARTVLRTLADASIAQIVAVVAQPDRPAGRHLHPIAPPVKVEALQRGLPVLQPQRARDADFLAQLRALAPDLIAVAAYGQILPASILELPRYGCLNVHTSLLPRWRGAAPIQWAIAEGDTETGVTLMQMDVGMDTGPILRSRSIPISEGETGQSLHDRLAELGGRLLVETIPPYVAGELKPTPQPTEGVSYARKLTKDDGRLRWTEPAAVLARRLRAFTPWPGGFCWIPSEPKPRLLKIHAAHVASRSEPAPPGNVIAANDSGIWVACGEGALVLTEVQLEGGRRLSAEQFSAGHALSRLD